MLAGVAQLRLNPVGSTSPGSKSLLGDLKIYPVAELGRALGCTWSYAEAIPVKCTSADLSGFIAPAEDMVAEFFADVATSWVAKKFLPGFRPDGE